MKYMLNQRQAVTAFCHEALDLEQHWIYGDTRPFGGASKRSSYRSGLRTISKRQNIQ